MTIDIFDILSSKPHNKHYLNRYYKFIQSCNEKNKLLDKSVYTENHHICPKSKDLFPEYTDFNKNNWNKVELTDHQHYVAHWLLWKTFGGKQTYAFMSMSNNMNPDQMGRKNKRINGKTYKLLKESVRKQNKIDATGKASYIDHIGNKFYCRTDDQRVLNGELISASIGRRYTWIFKSDKHRQEYKNIVIDTKWIEYPIRKISLYFLEKQIEIQYTKGMVELLPYLEQGWGFNMTPEFATKRAIETNINRFENKVNDMILNGDYSIFEYLLDIENQILVYGVYTTLDREFPGVYIKYGANKNFRTYKDILTGKIHQINPSIFPVPNNFKLWNTRTCDYI